MRKVYSGQAVLAQGCDWKVLQWSGAAPTLDAASMDVEFDVRLNEFDIEVYTEWSGSATRSVPLEAMRAYIEAVDQFKKDSSDG